MTWDNECGEQVQVSLFLVLTVHIYMFDKVQTGQGTTALSACITSTHCACFHVLHITQHAYILRRPAEAAILVVVTTSVFKREGMDQRTQMQWHRVQETYQSTSKFIQWFSWPSLTRGFALTDTEMVDSGV